MVLFFLKNKKQKRKKKKKKGTNLSNNYHRNQTTTQFIRITHFKNFPHIGKTVKLGYSPEITPGTARIWTLILPSSTHRSPTGNRTSGFGRICFMHHRRLSGHWVFSGFDMLQVTSSAGVDIINHQQPIGKPVPISLSLLALSLGFLPLTLRFSPSHLFSLFLE
jgi:hypothetical protein